MSEDQHGRKDSDWEPWKASPKKEPAKPQPTQPDDSTGPKASATDSKESGEEEQRQSFLKSPSAFFGSLFKGEKKKVTYRALILAGIIFAILVGINIFVSPRTRPLPASGLKPPYPQLEATKPEKVRPSPSTIPSEELKTATNQESGPAPAVRPRVEPENRNGTGSGKQTTPFTEIGQPSSPPVTTAAGTEVEGVKFTLALIKTLDYELNKATFGWRPNSLLFGKLGLTDDANNRQLGVLETVRIVSVVLKDKISRYGDADSFNPRLENAVNLFMNSAFQFWFPSADSQFNQGLDELRKYMADLRAGKARFYPRSDNFALLIQACKELLGNCYHNLVKKTEADGSTVSMWTVDDYFYYAQGVARAMSVILESCLTEFSGELDQIKGANLLREVVGHLTEAGQLSPLLVLDGKLDGFRANHRANLAVPVGEAHFKLSNMLKY